MKKTILLLLAATIYYGLQAQESLSEAPKKIVPNMATIKTFDGKELKGWFYGMNDSGMVIIEKERRYRKQGKIPDADKNIPAHAVKFEQIQSLTLQKKNSVMKGLIIGLGTGILTGAVIGFANGDDKIDPYPIPGNDPYGLETFFTGLGNALSNAFAMTAGQKAAVGAIAMGTMGALTGIIIGSIAKKKFVIGGSKKQVRDLDSELRRRLMIQ